MKSYLIILLPAILVSCKPSATTTDADSKNNPTEQASPTVKSAPFNASPLQGYFLKNTVATTKAVQIHLIANADEFEAMFGMAKTMTNEITPIDFQTQNVVAIFTAPSESQTTIELPSVTTAGNTIRVGYKVVTGEKQTFTSNALTLFTVPKEITALDARIFIQPSK